jgi:N-acetylmuramoyl-L-alanine amidase
MLRTPRAPSTLALVLTPLLAVLGLAALAVGPADAAPARPATAPAVTAAAAVQPSATTLPAPHPVAPKMQVLQPRGVDRPAVQALQSGPVQARAALAGAAADAQAPALATAPTATGTFQLVGLTWAAKGAPAGISIKVRVREHGAWGGWQVLGLEDAGPDAGTAEGKAAAKIDGSDPLLSNGADGVQVVVHTATGRAPAGLKVDLINAGTSAADGEPATPPTAVVQAAGAEPGGSAAQPAVASAVGPAAAPPAGTASPEPINYPPPIITRAQWGADESIRKPVDFNSVVRAMIIHHTDTINTYTTLAQAEQQVRAVYAFHVNGRGWSDIGYNFVVDRFGHVFEGRAGSITKAVLGAHTGGFNTDTMGVAALGTFTTATPPTAMVSSIAKVVAWKMSEYAMNVNGTVQLTSKGGGTDKWPVGQVITVNTVTGHRTFGATECPGDGLWAKLATIRSQATAIIAKEPPGTGYWPVTGVWTAGGGVQPGWFRNGYWSLRKPDGTTLQVRFGKTGDIPVVGDWNGDGVDGVGVYRDGTWYITSQLTAQPPHDSTWVYGSAGMLPLVGVWPGTSTLGIGVNKSNAWSFRGSLSAGPSLTGFRYGQIGDEPIAADWDGDGTSSVGVLRLGATWYLIDNLIATSPERVFTYGHFLDTASAGDWDGNGSVTPTVARSDQWLLRNDLKGGVATGTKTFAPS